MTEKDLLEFAEKPRNVGRPLDPLTLGELDAIELPDGVIMDNWTQIVPARHSRPMP